MENDKDTSKLTTKDIVLWCRKNGATPPAPLVPIPLPVSVGTVPIIQTERPALVEYCNYCGYAVTSSSVHLACIESNVSNDYLLKMYKRIQDPKGKEMIWMMVNLLEEIRVKVEELEENVTVDNYCMVFVMIPG